MTFSSFWNIVIDLRVGTSDNTFVECLFALLIFLHLVQFFNVILDSVGQGCDCCKI